MQWVPQSNMDVRIVVCNVHSTKAIKFGIKESSVVYNIIIIIYTPAATVVITTFIT